MQTNRSVGVGGFAGGDGGAGLPRRQLGRTGVTVPILALGGWHILKTSEEEGCRIVQEAIDAGLTFFRQLVELSQQSERSDDGEAAEGHRHDVFLMTKMCTHGCGKMSACCI